MNQSTSTTAHNFEVWARRMGVKLDFQKAVAACEENFPGMPYLGPLAIVIANSLRRDLDQKIKRAVGLLAAMRVEHYVSHGALLEPEKLTDVDWDSIGGDETRALVMFMSRRAIDARAKDYA